MNNEKTIKVVQMVTIFAVIFAVLIVTALILNLVKLSSLTARESELKTQIANINREIDENGKLLDYRRTDEYIDQYAREHLNMIGQGDEAFLGKK